MLDFINTHFEETISEGANLIEEGLVLYEHLWTIFRPGIIVYARILGKDRAFKLLSYAYVCGQRPGFQVNVSFIDYDGESFGTRQTSLMIPMYAGAARVVLLDVFPIDFHPLADSVKSTLIKRGELFQSLTGQCFREYAGVAIQMEKCKVIRCKYLSRTSLSSNLTFQQSTCKAV